LIKALKALSLAFSCFSLAFSRLSCSVSLLISSASLSISSLSLLTRKMSLSICFVRCLLCSISSSIPRTGRQLSIDKSCRHRGSDEGDAPWLGDGEAEVAEADVVIGGEQGDQAENHAAAGLQATELIEAGPGALCCG
jgi:hypothetical protein